MRFDLRIGEQRVESWQLGDLLGRAVDDPDRLAAPLDRHLFARLEAADVGLDRGAGGLGAFRRLETAHEGNGDEHAAGGAGAADAISHVRLLVSIRGRSAVLTLLTLLSLMEILNLFGGTWVNQGL